MATDLVKAPASEILTPIDFKEALPLFQKAWNQTREALFALLELIQKYKDRPKFDALCDELERQGIIKRSVMSMLSKISSNPVLMSPDYREQMPSSYNTLWTLTAVDEDTLKHKITKKQIDPNLTLEEARAIKASVKSDGKPTSAAKLELIASIRMSGTAAKKNRAAINACLKEIEDLGATINYNPLLKK